MKNKKNSLQYIHRFFTITFILSITWFGFLWLVKAPPIDAVPALLMVWLTAIILLLAFFPSILGNVGRLKIGEVEFELRETVQKTNTQKFILVADLSDIYELTTQGNAGGLQTILAQAIENPGKPVLIIFNLQEQKITRAFLFAFIMLLDLLNSHVIIAFDAGISSNRIKITDMIGLVAGKELLNAYHRRFPSLMNIFIREKEITSALEVSGLVQIPSSELIMGLYDQCRMQIAQDIKNEKGRYTGFEHPELGESLTDREIEIWLKDILNRQIINKPLSNHDMEVIAQALTDKEDYVLVSVQGIFDSALILNDFNHAVTQNVLRQLIGNK